MASSRNLYNRHKIGEAIPPSAKSKAANHNAITKSTFRSLVFSITAPLILTTTIIILFGSGPKYRASAKPFWFPPLWLIHLASLGSSFFMSLAAWLVWADGGFHEQADALPLYIAQFSLSVIWDPLVLVIGAVWLGLFFCVIHFGTLFACYKTFKKVNPFAKDLVKPCLAWMGFLTIVTYKLIYL
ncbi:translocator protein homolog [Mangifera indica]|uniref:translocator protein homolog n=1 Tax=Mangifera indica TaxID=29780 RepID=UPI001CFA451E|nr:translocator protein homolog [Mangifera indica]